MDNLQTNQIKCKICGAVFTNQGDFMMHLTELNKEKTGGFFPKQDHAIPQELHDKIVNSWNSKEPCAYCGGYVRHTGGGTPDGGAWWLIECDDCGYLYDED